MLIILILILILYFVRIYCIIFDKNADPGIGHAPHMRHALESLEPNFADYRFEESEEYPLVKPDCSERSEASEPLLL